MPRTVTEKKTWRLHKTITELQTWSAYLAESSDRFKEELETHAPTLATPLELKLIKEVTAGLGALKTESALIRSRSRRLRGHQ